MAKYVITIIVAFFLFGTLYASEDVKEYDYVIIGGGASGCVLANRLSADGNNNVLLLEAGPDASFLSRIPALTLAMYYTKNADLYLLEKQDNAGLGLKDQRISALKGKGLGGTTLVDHMGHTRGHRDDYDKWASLGNPGWSYNDLLPYFMKSEDVQIAYLDGSVRGTTGELKVQESPYRTESVYAFLESCRESGLEITKDYNNGEPRGCAFAQSVQRDGKRYTADKAFLDPIKKRKNLKIQTKSRATKIVINKETKTAEGIEYDHGSSTYQVRAKKEVILAAGGFGSAQLLMLSGIGPEEHLRELGLRVIKDLPVGRIMRDHFAYPFFTFTLNQSVTPMVHDLLNPVNILSYIFKGDGPYSIASFLLEGIGFARTEYADNSTKAPDMEIIFASGSASTDYGLMIKPEFRLGTAAYKQMFEPNIFKHTFMLMAVLLHPFSKGYLKLNSSDPYDAPILHSGLLEGPGNMDIKTLVAGIRMAQRIGNSPALKKYGAKQILTPSPGCEDKTVDSDEFWECQIRHLTISFWHESSTCKMGPKDDPEAVVDNELKVYGINNLRVADISVLPVTTSGHTSAPAYVIGEKAADLILRSRYK